MNIVREKAHTKLAELPLPPLLVIGCKDDLFLSCHTSLNHFLVSGL